MWVYTHPDCLQHDPGPGHPESPARLSAVTSALHQALPQLRWLEAPLATRAQIARVHDRGLVASVLDTVTTTPMRLDPDTVLCPDSAQAALRACGAGIAAVDAVLGDRTRQAFCAVRPPGHHATGSTAMGFCLFNSVAVAAAHALAGHALQRVAILDFDVHHGNGTQAIFEQDPRVLYLSSHQWPLYPDSGLESEIGLGNVFNAPLPPGSNGQAFRAAWQHRLLPALDAFAPQLVLVSAGFDGHRLDPLADLQLEADDFRWLSTEIAALAERHAGGRVVSMLEGGYSLSALRECSVAHLLGLGA
ncbi:MAG: histone deacetylase family protein [Arenimonas sp.]|nr:histone deacetylase family protein [Arenimonas sp.]MBP8098007.1 histone deacetylase family protein [Arenimonas sp.]